MSRIPRDIIDQIFQTARIEEVIGEFVQLKKSGSNLKGLSPFNNEKTPSFMVSPAKQIFKCFSSGKGGNVVSFLMELEQMSYPEALRWLAKKYNIEVPESRPQTPEEIEATNAREGVFLISEVAQKFFVEQLHNTDEGKAIGLSYFTERGFTPEIIEKFGLGYSPQNKTAFASFVQEEKYSTQHLLDSGISLQRESGQWYDRFWGRVIFPIYSISGRVLGFGGRVMQKDAKTAKYLNSPENPIYNKSKILFGLYHAKQAIVKQDEAYLVEGYTDVLSFFQNGVENVVASSGTALTEDQIRLIKRYTPNVTLLFDGDAAGIRASFRGVDMLLEQGMNVRVVAFPEGEDPDSYAQAHTQEELQAFLDNGKRDFISFKTELLLEETGKDPLKRAQLVRDIVASIAKVPDAIGREVFIKEASRLMEIEPATLFDALYQLQEKEARQQSKQQRERPPMEVVPPEAPVPERKILGYDQELDLIKLLISSGTETMVEEELAGEDLDPVPVAFFVADELDEDGLTFSIPLFQEAFDLLLEEMDKGTEINSDWWATRTPQTMAELVTEALTETYTLADWSKKDIYLPRKENLLFPLVEQTVLRFKYVFVERKLEALKGNLEREAIDTSVYLNEFKKWNDLRQQINDKLRRVV